MLAQATHQQARVKVAVVLGHRRQMRLDRLAQRERRRGRREIGVAKEVLLGVQRLRQVAPKDVD